MRSQRTTEDLINELIDESKNLWIVAIVCVDFEWEAQYVINNLQKHELIDKINFLINKGGKPIGLIGLNPEDVNGGLIMTRPFFEYAEVKWVKDYLRDLTICIAKEGILTQLFCSNR